MGGPLRSMSVEKAFSRAAKSYSSHASVQARVASDLLAACGSFSEYNEALDLGCGTGVVASLLLSSNAKLQLDCLDSSTAMIEELRRSLASQGLRARQLIVADARCYQGRSYPLVLSSSALQWMEPLNQTLASWRKLCMRGGTLALACMVNGTLAELHRARLSEIPTVPPLRELPTAAALHEAIEVAGFLPSYFDVRDYRLELGSVLDLFRALSLTGTATGPFSRGARLLTVPELRRIARHYTSEYPTESGGIYATYRTAIVVANSP